MKKNNSTRFLLLVDIEEAFSPPAALLRRIEKILLEYERVFFTRFVISKGSLFDRKGFHKGKPGTGTNIALPIPKNGTVLTKDTYGLHPRHIRTLKRAGVKHIDVGGVDTDACVLACLFSLWDNGISFSLKKELSHSTRSLDRLAHTLIQENFFPETK